MSVRPNLYSYLLVMSSIDSSNKLFEILIEHGKIFSNKFNNSAELGRFKGYTCKQASIILNISSGRFTFIPFEAKCIASNNGRKIDSLLAKKE